MCTGGLVREPASMNVIEVTDLTSATATASAVDGVSFVGRGRRDLRHPRPERRRQDHHRRIHRRPAGARPRHDPRPGARSPTATATGSAPSSASSSRRASCPSGSPSREALELFASFYAEPADPRALIEDLGLEDQRDTAYRNLSGGQKQRLSIALALVGQPRIAILDELSTGLDPQARRETWQLIESIRDRGVTVLLVTHLMEEAERLADRVAVFGDGRVIALDTPAGIVVDGRPGAARPLPAVRRRSTTGCSPTCPRSRRVERTGPHVVVTGTGNLLAP